MVRHPFNMIEVALAMAVVMVGVVGVLALLPPSLDSSREAANEIYAHQAASTMIEYLRFFVKKGYAAFPNSIQSSSSAPTFPSSPSVTPATAKWETMIFEPSGYTNPTETPLLFCVSEMGTNVPKVHIRLYKNTINNEVFNGDTNMTLTRYYIEISWPVETAYANRNKRLFVYDVSGN